MLAFMDWAQPKRPAGAQPPFACIALILTGFFRLRIDTGGDKFGFLLLSAGRLFILRANTTPLVSALISWRERVGLFRPLWAATWNWME